MAESYDGKVPGYFYTARSLLIFLSSEFERPTNYFLIQILAKSLPQVPARLLAKTHQIPKNTHKDYHQQFGNNRTVAYSNYDHSNHDYDRETILL